MRAISNILKGNSASRNFQLAWGKALLSQLAPFADRKNYVSPFPEVKDEFEDYDYDKGKLLKTITSSDSTIDGAFFNGHRPMIQQRLKSNSPF